MSTDEAREKAIEVILAMESRHDFDSGDIPSPDEYVDALIASNLLDVPRPEATEGGEREALARVIASVAEHDPDTHDFYSPRKLADAILTAGFALATLAPKPLEPGEEIPTNPVAGYISGRRWAEPAVCWLCGEQALWVVQEPGADESPDYLMACETHVTAAFS